MPIFPRVQLFEFNDHPKAPAAVRDTIVEMLSLTLAWGRILKGLVAPFEDFLQECGAAELLDLGAGNGAPAHILATEIARSGRKPPRFLLTDLHPHVEAWAKLRAEVPEAIEFVEEPVDATRVKAELASGRARTIINVLHHFPPALAASIFEDAVRADAGIFVAEGFERNPLQFANMIAAGLPALLLNPLLAPRDRLVKALLSWFTPAVALMSAWDGIISTLRIHSEDELRAMVAPFGAGFRWEYGTYRYLPYGKGYYFYGVPRR